MEVILAETFMIQPSVLRGKMMITLQVITILYITVYILCCRTFTFH